jgi:hypothetical protein
MHLTAVDSDMRKAERLMNHRWGESIHSILARGNKEWSAVICFPLMRASRTGSLRSWGCGFARFLPPFEFLNLVRGLKWD